MVKLTDTSPSWSFSVETCHARGLRERTLLFPVRKNILCRPVSRLQGLYLALLTSYNPQRLLG